MKEQVRCLLLFSVFLALVPLEIMCNTCTVWYRCEVHYVFFPCAWFCLLMWKVLQTF